MGLKITTLTLLEEEEVDTEGEMVGWVGGKMKRIELASESVARITTETMKLAGELEGEPVTSNKVLYYMTGLP